MSKTKIETLASLIRSFVNQVNKDIKQKKSILIRYEGESADKVLNQFEHSAWLLCETAKEKRVRENNRRRLQQEPDLSEVLIKLNTKALPIFFKISNAIQEKQKSIIEEHFYPFEPDEKFTIKMNLKKIKDIIDEKKESSRVIKAALLCRKKLLKYIFKSVDKEFLNAKIVNSFLDDQNLDLETEKADPPEWKDTIFLKNRPGRCSISSQKVMNYIQYFVKWFLDNPKKFHTVGKTVLVIWLAQSAAHYLRRVCSINEIMFLRQQQLKSKESKEGLISYFFETENDDIPIPESLYWMLDSILDRRKDNPYFFSLDRSTIENHLKTASSKLGYHSNHSSVTPETFLERPIECGLDSE